MYSYLKHFALNDQESYRADGLDTWANEQTVREIYLKPFRIAVSEARSTLTYLDGEGKRQTKSFRSATGIMAAQNCIGGTYGHTDRALLTDVLRGEWNFQGAVITDLWMSPFGQERDMALRAGSDLFMLQLPGCNAVDYDSATARTAMRQAIHRIGGRVGRRSYGGSRQG